MPVKKCDNGKYRIGDGECMYTTKEDAEKAYDAYLTKKHSDDLRKEALKKLSKKKK